MQYRYLANPSWSFRFSREVEGLLVGAQGSGKSLLLRGLFDGTIFSGVVPEGCGALRQVTGLPGWEQAAHSVDQAFDFWAAVTADLLGQRTGLPAGPDPLRPSSFCLVIDPMYERLKQTNRRAWLAFDGFEQISDPLHRRNLIGGWLQWYENIRLRYLRVVHLSIALRPEDLADVVGNVPLGADFAKVTAAKSVLVWPGRHLLALVANTMLNREAEVAPTFLSVPTRLTRLALRRDQAGQWTTVKFPNAQQVAYMLQRYGSVTKAQTRRLAQVERGSVEETPGTLLKFLGLQE